MKGREIEYSPLTIQALNVLEEHHKLWLSEVSWKSAYSYLVYYLERLGLQQYFFCYLLLSNLHLVASPCLDLYLPLSFFNISFFEFFKGKIITDFHFNFETSDFYFDCLIITGSCRFSIHLDSSAVMSLNVGLASNEPCEFRGDELLLSRHITHREIA